MLPIFLHLIYGLSLVTLLILGAIILKKIRKMEETLLQTLLDSLTDISNDLTSIATSISTIEAGIPESGALAASDVQVLKQKLATVSAAADTLAASALAAATPATTGEGSTDTGSVPSGTGDDSGDTTAPTS